MTKFTLTLPTGTLAGSIKLVVGGTTTGEIAHPLTAAKIQSEVRKLSGESAAKVTGSSGGPFTIEVTATTLTVDDTATTGKDSGQNFAVVNATAVVEAIETFSDLQNAKGNLIRKGLSCIVLVAPMTTRVPEDIFTDEGKIVNFAKLGYESVGWTSKDAGVSFTRSTDKSEVESYGAAEPTRSDITKDTMSAKFEMQETKKITLAMYYGIDLTDVKVKKNTQTQFIKQNLPETVYRRALFIFRDGTEAKPIFMIFDAPKTKVSDPDELAFSAEKEVKYGVTLEASRDDELDYSMRFVYGGLGWKELAPLMGFEVES